MLAYERVLLALSSADRHADQMTHSVSVKIHHWQSLMRGCHGRHMIAKLLTNT
jgi:hypothetical protein